MAVDTPISAPSRAQSLRPTQFSLWKLMLAMVACCVLAALLGRLQQVHQQVASLRRELAVQREKNVAAGMAVGHMQRELEIVHGRLGKLTIHDPHSIYLVALPARDEFEWKWRVYLPKENRWRVAARHGIFSDNRLVPDPDATRPLDSIAGLAGGEHEVRAYISLDLVQQRSVVVQIGDSTLRTPLSPVHERLILNDQNGSSMMQAGSARHLDENNSLINNAPLPIPFPIGKVELLRWTVRADSSKPDGYAIQIWIEPDSDPIFDFESAPPLERSRPATGS